MTYSIRGLFFPVMILLLIVTACKEGKDKNGDNKKDDTEKELLEEYDLSKFDKFNMPESLHEISGIAFHKGNNDTIYAIQDEEGKVFRLAWDIKKQYNVKFGKKGDYEDVAIVNEQIIVLKSSGSLYSFPFADAIYEEIDSAREWKHILPEGEYEGMYGDDSTGKLYVICKNCAEDDNHNNVSGYIFDTKDSIYQTGKFSINVDEIKSIAGKVKHGFRPSAISKSPLTNEWYILSSVNKLLIVTDAAWKIKAVHPLNGNQFSQPEGIAFDAQGNLYISDEGDDLAEGNIYKFQPSVKQPDTNNQPNNK